MGRLLEAYQRAYGKYGEVHGHPPEHFVLATYVTFSDHSPTS